MRVRAIVAIGVLLVPSVAEAQIWLPILGRGSRGGIPIIANEMPEKTATVVSKAIAVNRMRSSAESFMHISHFNTGGVNVNGSSAWTSAGMGLHVDYRVARATSLTMDLTQTFAGGPVAATAGELGVRVGPRRADGLAYAFVDARGGYYSTYMSNFFATDDLGVSRIPQAAPISHFANGFGGLVGAGVEFPLTTRFSLATSFAMGRAHMQGTSATPELSIGQRYTMTSKRLVLGLRYNGVRYTRIPGSANSASQH